MSEILVCAVCELPEGHSDSCRIGKTIKALAAFENEEKAMTTAEHLRKARDLVEREVQLIITKGLSAAMVRFLANILDEFGRAIELAEREEK